VRGAVLLSSVLPIELLQQLSPKDFNSTRTDTQRYTDFLGGLLENTARLLKVARAHNVPIATCFTAYKTERDMPHWKVAAVRHQFRLDHPSSTLDPRIYDKDYDVVVCKFGPSIFFQTPVVPYFIKEGVETVIITGCNTSGCIRASTIDSFQWGFRTIVPEDCVGDIEEGLHRDNLRDVGRRYADVLNADEVIAYIKQSTK
jgi:maleamate amidohydrolase